MEKYRQEKFTIYKNSECQKIYIYIGSLYETNILILLYN